MISIIFNTLSGKSQNENQLNSDLCDYVIAYCYQPVDGSGLHQIYTINGDGSENSKLINSTIGLNHHNWSPDGNKMAAVGYVGTDNTTWSIHVFDADGSNLTRLTNTINVWDNDPAWSPDGSLINFTRIYPGQDMRQEIWIMNSDGSNQHWIGIEGGSAKWSPDGTRLIYQSNKDGNSDIYSCDIDGNNETQITDTEHNEFSPVWSPDGSQIVYSSDFDGDREIYTMNSDGTNAFQLSYNDYTDGSPKWSPDGEKIAYTSGPTGEWNIYIMNANGRNSTRVTNYEAPITAINADFKPSIISGIGFSSEKNSDIDLSVTNYPNPFSQSTTIAYNLSIPTIVRIKIYDLFGREIKTLLNEYQLPGKKIVNWNGKDQKGNSVTSGLYFYNINTGKYNKSNSMISLDD
ncbi:T9SS type A sorting domain-containing protein [Bacteroidota bacterium]